MEKISKQFWDDMVWGEKHHSVLLEKYRDSWIAVNNKMIVASGSNLREVKKKAKQITGKTVPVLFIECGAHIYG